LVRALGGGLLYGGHFRGEEAQKRKDSDQRGMGRFFGEKNLGLGEERSFGKRGQAQDEENTDILGGDGPKAKKGPGEDSTPWECSRERTLTRGGGKKGGVP